MFVNFLESMWMLAQRAKVGEMRVLSMKREQDLRLLKEAA